MGLSPKLDSGWVQVLAHGLKSQSEVNGFRMTHFIAPFCNEGDLGLIPGSGRSPGGGHDNPLQYSCLENPMERGAWWATVHRGCKESDTTERLTLSLS